MPNTIRIRALNLQSRGALNKVGANSSTSQLREGTVLLSSSRRTFLQSVSKSAAVLSLEGVLAQSRRWRAFFPASEEVPKPGASLGLSFIDVARESGLNAKTIYGGEHKNKYLLETTGCGVAFYDYDNDGWLDIFLVNGWRLEGFPAGQEPTSHLFKNNRDGTFTDVTTRPVWPTRAGDRASASATTTTMDSRTLFVTYFGKNVLYHNNGDGTFFRCKREGGRRRKWQALEYRLRLRGLRPRRQARPVRRQLH